MLGLKFCSFYKNELFFSAPSQSAYRPWSELRWLIWSRRSFACSCHSCERYVVAIVRTDGLSAEWTGSSPAVCAQHLPGLHGDDQSWSERSEKRWVFREDFQADCLTVGHGFLLQGQARSAWVSCATTGCPQEDAMHLSFLLVKWWCLHPRKSLNFHLLCSRGSSEACEIGVLF